MNIKACCQKPLVLAVDDDLDNLALIQYQLLEVIDCLLITATDGETALSLIQAEQPHLVLMDILLPGMEGTEVLKQLKKSPATETIPVIAVTALARGEDRDRILQSGCDDYVSKPYNLEELEAAILRHLHLCHS